MNTTTASLLLLICLLAVRDVASSPLKDATLGGNELDSVLLQDSGSAWASGDIAEITQSTPNPAPVVLTKRTKRATASIGLNFTGIFEFIESFARSFFNIVTFKWTS